MDEKITSNEPLKDILVNDILDRCNDIWAECEVLEAKQKAQLDILNSMP